MNVRRPDLPATDSITRFPGMTRFRSGWRAQGTGDHFVTTHATRREAEARLAATSATRALVAAESDRREHARTIPPAGWRFASWDHVKPGDVIRTPGRCLPVEPGAQDGPLSPESWGDPVTVTRVLDLGNGCVVANGMDARGNPAWLRMGVLLITVRYRAVGVLIPDAEAEA